MLPRKGKAIEGVDTSSLVGLHAAVYRAQQQRLGQAPRDLPAAASIGRGRDLFATRNRGVDERDERVRESEARAQERAGSSLARKSELYAQLMRGSAAEDALGSAADESLVDWGRKQCARATLVSADMERDAERRAWERDAAAEVERGGPPSAAVERNSSVKRFLDEVVQDTAAERERAAVERTQRDRERATRSELIASKRAALKRARVEAGRATGMQ
ncbi:hypothetical protein KFE25_012890 [Diacronema lutheri]|uniref:Uncharacterized protein n=1 Tax=Diacronema lutheri TaxID=2081491 RepID=A0A7R9UM75_DIALT|nr:hypothetical protein KFE25_012890 [Diacronema lutheri]|mmetsp:Transcript_14639/g.45776  ORF Transcript_14639/g.45776 Transcript_14639/m.45776 type:complete len:218 (+) Transcript_14639:56-709(+)